LEIIPIVIVGGWANVGLNRPYPIATTFRPLRNIDGESEDKVEDEVKDSVALRSVKGAFLGYPASPRDSVSPIESATKSLETKKKNKQTNKSKQY
jgi:hypothetical protein